jgi:hypothetical protein
MPNLSNLIQLISDGTEEDYWEVTLEDVSMLVTTSQLWDFNQFAKVYMQAAHNVLPLRSTKAYRAWLEDCFNRQPPHLVEVPEEFTQLGLIKINFFTYINGAQKSSDFRQFGESKAPFPQDNGDIYFFPDAFNQWLVQSGHGHLLKNVNLFAAMKSYGASSSESAIKTRSGQRRRYWKLPAHENDPPEEEENNIVSLEDIGAIL